MNLIDKVKVLETDIDILKKGIDRVVEKYPYNMGILVRGNKSGLSITVEKDFDKVEAPGFMQKRQGQA